MSNIKYNLLLISVVNLEDMEAIKKCLFYAVSAYTSILAYVCMQMLWLSPRIMHLNAKAVELVGLDELCSRKQETGSNRHSGIIFMTCIRYSPQYARVF